LKDFYFIAAVKFKQIKDCCIKTEENEAKEIQNQSHEIGKGGPVWCGLK
jgi:hypothetical protein